MSPINPIINPISLRSGGIAALALLLLFSAAIPPADAHSWIEQARRIARNGTFIGEPGYPRGMISRQQPGFTDVDLYHHLPPNGRAEGPVILASDTLARYDSGKYTDEFPRLRAAPGEIIALRYQENGHVSLPDAPADKPANRGTVFIYATDQSVDDTKFLDVHHIWNTDGTGGDGRGKLIATRNYDDGLCHQINGGDISLSRAGELGKEHDDLQGNDLWCQVDVRIPEDVAVGSVYTMYWVWDWPTLSPDLVKSSANGVYPTQGDGVVVPEVYTSALDIEIIAADKNDVAGSALFAASANGGENQDAPLDFIEDQDVNYRAVENQLDNMFLVDPPAGSEEPGSGGDGEDTPDLGSTAIGSTTIGSSTTSCTGPIATEAPEGDKKTVTVTVTLEPTTVYTVVVVPASDTASAPAATPDTPDNSNIVNSVLGGVFRDDAEKPKARRWSFGLF